MLRPLLIPMRLLVFGAITALIVIVAGSSAAHAEDTGTITWSVRPADENAADGRSWAELELDPGESIVEHVAVRNLSAEAVTFGLAAADGYFTDRGRFTMLPSDTDSIDAGTWIDIAGSVAVDAGATVIVPYTITVPDLAQPGDHAAGIAASVLSVQSGDGTQVGVESRVGFRVMTRVTGEIAPSLEMASVSSDYTVSWNPFEPGSLFMTFTLVNSGNARLVVTGAVRLGDNVASFPADNETALELLPGDSKTVTASLEDVWPLGPLFTDVELEPTVIAVDGSQPATVERSVTQVVSWAIPWPQLIVAAGATFLVIAAIYGRIRTRRRISALVVKARAEGERAARASVEVDSRDVLPR